MKSLLLDSNIFLRFFLNDIPSQQRAAQQLLQKAKAKKVDLKVAQIVIFEIEFTLTKYYLFPKNEVIDRLESLVGVPYLDIQDRGIFQRAINLYQDKNLSLPDCFLRAKSEIEGLDIFTFDKKLAKY